MSKKLLTIICLSTLLGFGFGSCKHHHDPVDDGEELQEQVGPSRETPFITEWDLTKISGQSTSISLPLPPWGKYNFIVDWGDGTTNVITAYDDPNVTHNYANYSGDIVQISITDTIEGWCFGYNTNSASALVDVSQWGCLYLDHTASETYDGMGKNEGYFSYTYNLNHITAPDTMNLINVVSLAEAFYRSGIQTINNIEDWDVSNVTNMRAMFSAAQDFNDDISSWDVSNVSSMAWMFYAAKSFNSSIGTWEVSNVSNMEYLFYDASNFTQDLSNWELQSGTAVTFIFADSGLKGDKDKWPAYISSSEELSNSAIGQ